MFTITHRLFSGEQGRRVGGVSGQGGRHSVHHHRRVPVDVPDQAALPAASAAAAGVLLLLLLGILRHQISPFVSFVRYHSYTTSLT